MDQQDRLSPEQLLAAALRELREAAGRPAISWLALQSGFSEATVCDALSGRHRPSRRVLVAMVTALGADPELWGARWDGLDRARRAARPKVGRLDAAGKPVCGIDGCPNKRWGARWCGTHQAHYRRSGDPAAGTFLPMMHAPTCSVEGCDGT